MPSDRLRFVPDDIRRDLGAYLSDDFLEAYDLLCEAVYFGANERDDIEVDINARRTADAHDFFFKDFGLYELKTDADRALRQICASLHRWKRTGAGRRAARPARSRRGDLAAARGARHRDGAVRAQDTEALGA